LETVSAWVRRLEELIIAAGILVMASVTVANVFTRVVLGFSLSFAEELAQCCVIAVTFVGTAYAARIGRHIRMSALADQLGESARRRLLAFVSGSTALLMFVLAAASLRYLETMWALGSVSPALRLPMVAVYAWVPFGFGAAGLHWLATAVWNLRGEYAWVAPGRRDVPGEDPA
jgi:TRAP-type C4-dicarboxylate transport system permease small subunit